MSNTQLTPVEPGNRIQLPADWADALGLHKPVLLHMAHQQGAGSLATEDRQLARACGQFGITAETPLDAALRQQVAAWEAAHLAPKGLARVLRRVHHWLQPIYPQAALDFWTQTSGGSHLP